MAGMALHRQRHILQRRELAQDRGDLEGAAEAQPHARVGGQAGDVAAGEMDGARIRRDHAGELVTRVVLPAPFGPISAWISPGRTSIDTLSVASRPP